MNGEEKLSVMRTLMKERGYDAYIFPHGDQHDNEYIAEADERMKFISGFSGDNGMGLVTKDVALMWTDGRFYISIEKELYPGWKMKKMERGEERLTEYINKNIPPGSKIAMDYHLFTQDTFNDIASNLTNYILEDDVNNIIDDIWGTIKPKYSNSKVIIVPVKYTGKTVFEKYEMLKKMLEGELIQAEDIKVKCEKKRLLINRLDDIAWLLNIRGSDIPYNPVFFSYCLFYTEEKKNYCHLFVDKSKFDTPELKQYCAENLIYLYNYDEIYSEISKDSEGKIFTLTDSDSVNTRMASLINSKQKGSSLMLPYDLIEHMKGVKNQVEIQGYRNANLKDSVALIKFFTWLEDEIVNKKREDLNEYEIGVKNKQCREDQELFMGESFHPICGVGPNAAIIHYEQTESKHSNMSIDKIILCDTGAQYMDGTTDITRTVHFGTPTPKEKEMYTRVLLGNLSLERTKFKIGEKLKNIDSIPRSYLMQVGQDYKHGTSHGVGHFLNVHEGPYGMPLKPGNIITNEPGYYEKDAFGIRIENEVLVVKASNTLLGFENITPLPYERNLIDLNLISNDFKNYIDAHHKKVYETLSPLLKDYPKELDYLKRKTAPL